MKTTFKCLSCFKIVEVWPSQFKKGRSKFCSKICYSKWQSENMKAENHPCFKPETTNYSSVHNWLRRTFGNASHCENLDCEKKTTHYEWSLLQNKKYSRDINNFWQLCRNCHRKYDYYSPKGMAEQRI